MYKFYICERIVALQKDILVFPLLLSCHLLPS